MRKKKNTINLIKNLGSFSGAKKSAKEKSSSSRPLKNSFFFLMSHVYLLFFYPTANIWVKSVQVLAAFRQWTPAHSSLLPGSPRSYPSILPELFVRGTPHLFRRNNSQGFWGEKTKHQGPIRGHGWNYLERDRKSSFLPVSKGKGTEKQIAGNGK